MGLVSKLSLTKAPSRTVQVRVDDDGINLTHKAIADGETAEVVCELTMSYMTAQELTNLQNEMAIRKITNTKKRMKSLVPDARALYRTVAGRVVTGWKMNFGALRRLEVPIDYAGHKDDEDVPFNREDLEYMANASVLGNLILGCLNDFEFWFPETKEQEGNLGSGPSGSTSPTEPVPSASTAT